MWWQFYLWCMFSVLLYILFIPFHCILPTVSFFSFIALLYQIIFQLLNFINSWVMFPIIVIRFCLRFPLLFGYIEQRLVTHTDLKYLFDGTEFLLLILQIVWSWICEASRPHLPYFYTVHYVTVQYRLRSVFPVPFLCHLLLLLFNLFNPFFSYLGNFFEVFSCFSFISPMLLRASFKIWRFLPHPFDQATGRFCSV